MSGKFAIITGTGRADKRGITIKKNTENDPTVLGGILKTLAGILFKIAVFDFPAKDAHPTGAKHEGAEYSEKPIQKDKLVNISGASFGFPRIS